MLSLQKNTGNYQLVTIYIQLYTVTAEHWYQFLGLNPRAVQHFHNELNRECIVVTRKGLMFCPYLTPNTFQWQ